MGFRFISRSMWKMGFLGFFGLLGFMYFSSGELSRVINFVFFGFFGYFFFARLSADVPDERYKENQLKARAFLYPYAIVSLGALAISSAILQSAAITAILCALFFAGINIAYAAALVHYENE